MSSLEDKSPTPLKQKPQNIITKRSVHSISSKTVNEVDELKVQEQFTFEENQPEQPDSYVELKK